MLNALVRKDAISFGVMRDLPPIRQGLYQAVTHGRELLHVLPKLHVQPPLADGTLLPPHRTERPKEPSLCKFAACPSFCLTPIFNLLLFLCTVAGFLDTICSGESLKDRYSVEHQILCDSNTKKLGLH